LSQTARVWFQVLHELWCTGALRACRYIVKILYGLWDTSETSWPLLHKLWKQTLTKIQRKQQQLKTAALLVVTPPTRKRFIAYQRMSLDQA